jgi:2-polyprenyl-3-methyl-5-hydroxy-6-metoxy-1,4-benzoquinol methylase
MTFPMNAVHRLEVEIGRKRDPTDSSNLNDKAQVIWNKNAPFWDRRMGERGNEFHRILIEPTTLKLLDLKRGESVLDIACGNGQFSRRIARLGARIVAFDFSEKFIRRAKKRKYGKKIDYRIVDATNREELLTLGKNSFDAAVCTMAFMDIADITPLISTLPTLLRPKSRFVFSVMHPCFNAVGMSHIVEYEETDSSEIQKKLSIKVREYIVPQARKGLGIIGQPVPQFYFHRPISSILNTCFKAGFVLDRFEEPTFPKPLDHKKAWSWSQCNRIPPVLIARMRLIGKTDKK